MPRTGMNGKSKSKTRARTRNGNIHDHVQMRAQSKRLNVEEISRNSDERQITDSQSTILNPEDMNRPSCSRNNNNLEVSVAANERDDRSSISITSSVRRAELEARAAQKRFEIQSRAIEEKARLELEMVDQQLARDLAGEREEDDLRSVITRRTQSRRSNVGRNVGDVQNWVNSSIGRQSLSGASDTIRMDHGSRTPVNTTRAAHVSEEATNVTQRLLQRATVGKRLPVFDGDVLEWPCFKRAFNESSRAGGFSEEENLIRLYESLKGTAKEAVASLMVTSRYSRQIMDVLDMRFGNANVTAGRIIDDIKCLPKIFHNNGDLVIFATKVKNCVAALEAANHVGYLHSHDLIREITQKLPYALIYNYHRYLNDHGQSGEPALVILSNFLFFEAEIACKAGTFDLNHTTTQRKRENVTQSKDRNSGNQREDYRGTKCTFQQQRVFNTVENDDKEVPVKQRKDNDKCGYCQTEFHFLTDCEQFIDSPMSDRWTWARDNKLCFKCLKSSNHQQNRCTEKSCGINDCLRNHHRLLHRSQEKNKRVGNSSSANRTNNQTKPSQRENEEL